MTGKDRFIEVCKKRAINYDEVFSLHTSETIGRRCKCTISSEDAKKCMYAVCYYKAEEIYVAWFLKNPNTNDITKLSLLANGLRSVDDNKIVVKEKFIERVNGTIEKVYVFKETMIEEFLKFIGK